MSYLTLGSLGQPVLDPFSRSAQELFTLEPGQITGLGKKKRGLKRIVKVVKRAISLTPAGGVLNLARMAQRAVARKVKRGAVAQQGGVTPGYDPALYPQYPPVGTQYSYPSAPVEDQYASVPPPVDSPSVPGAAPVAAPPYAPSYPDAGPGYEYEYSEAPTREGEGYTIEPGEEPWARPEAQAPGVEYDESEGYPDTSVEGYGCGGYIVTSPTPPQRTFANPKAIDALGQDEDFWYRPAPEYGESDLPAPSDWPPSPVSAHRGSAIWGDALRESGRRRSAHRRPF